MSTGWQFLLLVFRKQAYWFHDLSPWPCGVSRSWGTSRLFIGWWARKFVVFLCGLVHINRRFRKKWIVHVGLLGYGCGTLLFLRNGFEMLSIPSDYSSIVFFDNVGARGRGLFDYSSWAPHFASLILNSDSLTWYQLRQCPGVLVVILSTEVLSVHHLFSGVFARKRCWDFGGQVSSEFTTSQ